ncbi:H/ACA ribonucleoprotein complex non-core subunit NAF1 [Humulus lupulus]|uniref:H/ACA ribonucleoprotein complex non-core subunit NAF1 n=1 Tax=Humulus lupulus TaxID=3486 RepID=UPI002B40E2E0|nr:H/ACA ribonucleoprotein complex non-core subunit NAF1 [Humulus lupulus]
MSFTDSFLDFDSIKDWFDNISNPDMAEGAKIKTGALEADSYGEIDVQGPVIDQFDSNVVGSKPIAIGSGPSDCGSQFVVKVEERECEMSGSVNCLIEEVMGKVSLVGGSENSGMDENVVKSKIISDDIKSETMEENGMKSKIMSDKVESESSESEVETTSSYSSSSSGCSSSEDDTSDNDVEKEEVKEKEEKESMKVKVESKFNEVTEVEEGEIRDADGPDMVGQTRDDDNSEDEDEDDNDEEAMVTWSDVDVADEEEDGDGALKGPIKSKNELEVLPSVPPVNATLQPHHQMLSVGVVLSIIGTQVIVEGIEKHSPLNDGSILWITESRCPLGLVDEIFGPVKNPYYVVRYNSESEVPAGVQTGSLISFVPEFVSHVLNNKDVYKKGYDASGANDEEVYDDAEFSDDEKEAEFKRMQKMSKRGMNDQKPMNNKNDKRKVKNRAEPWKNSKHSSPQAPTDAGHVPPNQHQHHLSPHLAPVDNANSSTSFTVGQGLIGGAGLIPQLRPAAQTACFNPPSNGVWGNGMSFQQPQGAFFPGGFPAYGMPWLPQNSQQYPFQMAMPNMFPQQVDPSQRLLSANLLPGQQSNTLAGSAYSQGLVGQNGYNQMTFGMGLQGQPSQPFLNLGQQGINPSGLHNGQNCNVPQSGGIPGNNNEASQQFNVGASGRGRKPFRRGGGRFSHGRGGNQSR